MPGGKRNKRKRRRAAERREKEGLESKNNNNSKASSSSSSSSHNHKRPRKESDRTATNSNNMDNSKEESSACIVFQDVMRDILLTNKKDGGEKSDDGTSNNNDSDSEDYEEKVSLAFFELANSPYVGFRVTDDDDNEEEEEAKSNNNTPPNNNMTASHCSAGCIILKQDTNACGKHTGGIVWETAYLLLQYILETQTKLGKCLEVGAGCGLIGQVLAAKKNIVACTKIVMTEHPDVIPNLLYNVKRNIQHHAILKKEEDAQKEEEGSSSLLKVCNLDWENYQQDSMKNLQHLEPHSFDTILGTDVVFTPKLVEPLWETLQYMSHSKTNIYLCLQERCATSHKLLVEKAPNYNFQLVDITNQIDSIPSCRWGKALECRLFHITANDVVRGTQGASSR